MSERNAEQVLSVLADMDSAARTLSLDLDDSARHQETEVHVAFLVCGRRFLGLLRDLKEIIYVPELITRVPRVQPWMLGVANVRGNLLPIMDLQLFLCGTQQGITSHTRVLVVERENIAVGLQVPAVYGLRHLPVGIVTQPMNLGGAMAELVNGGHDFEGEVWPVFDIDALIRNPRFRVASL